MANVKYRYTIEGKSEVVDSTKADFETAIKAEMDKLTGDENLLDKITYHEYLSTNAWDDGGSYNL